MGRLFADAAFIGLFVAAMWLLFRAASIDDNARAACERAGGTFVVQRGRNSVCIAAPTLRAE